MAKRKTKPILCFILAFFMLIQSIMPAIITSYADDKGIVMDAIEERSEYSTYESSTNKVYLDKNLNSRPLFGPSSIANTDEQDLDYVMWRIFRKPYLYDVSKNSPPTDLGDQPDFTYDEREIYNVNGGKSICDPTMKRDGNYLYHNCDIPSVITGFRQAVLGSDNSSPIKGGEITSATEESGLGIPANLPEGGVPVKTQTSEDLRGFTGLELYGYNLVNTSYDGEWDNIDVNTGARLLANYGIIDRLLLAGRSVGSTLGGFFTGLSKFDWNPVSWISKAVSRGVGQGVLVILDTHDANVAATRGWGRPSFGNTVYNGITYLPNKIVAERTMRAYEEDLVSSFPGFMKKLIEEKKLRQEVYDTIMVEKDYSSYVPEFMPHFKKSYTPEYKSGQSYSSYNEVRKAYKKAQEEYLTCVRTSEEESSCGNPPEIPDKGDYEKATSKEQFEVAQPEIAAWLSEAEAKVGIDNPLNSGKNYEDYGKLQNDYTKNFKSTLKSEFNSQEWSDMNELIDKHHDEFMKSSPYYSVDREISHWVCVYDENQFTWTTEDLIDAPFLFFYNGDSDEYNETVNPGCNVTKNHLRPTIKGGAQGSGDLSGNNIHDTRWQVYNNRTQRAFMPNSSGNGIVKTFSTFLNKVLNTLLSFSFDDVLKRTGLTSMLVSVIETLRDGMYYPLIMISMAISAFYAMTKLVTQRSGIAVIKSLAGLLFVYVLGIIILQNPQRTLELVDVIPREVDNIIVNAMYGEESYEQNPLCSTDGDKIRSIQCEVWQIGVFSPWMMNQFGVSDYRMLDDNNMMYDDEVKELVETTRKARTVSFSMSNWAIYQLDMTKSGSITTKDTQQEIIVDGQIDRNLYRLVDMQFGPHNAKGRDTRFAQYWSGISRDGTWNVLALIVNFFMLIIIGKFLLYKLQISFSLIINFMLTPFMALMGLLPNGNIKFRNHLGYILGLFIKRSSITIFITLLLKFLIAGINTKLPLVPYYIYIIAVLLAFKRYWMDYLNLLDNSIAIIQSNGSLGTKLASGEYVDSNDVRKTIRNTKLIPKGVDQFVEESRAKTSGLIGGSIAGGVLALRTMKDRKDGNMKVSYQQKYYDKKTKQFKYKTVTKNATTLDVIKENAKDAANITEQRTQRQNRREGFGITRNMKRVADKVSNELAYEITGGDKSADSVYVMRSYNTLRNNGITFNHEDLIDNKKIQKYIKEYARLSEQFDLLLQQTPENNEQLYKQYDNIRQIQEKMMKTEQALLSIRQDLTDKEFKEYSKENKKNKAITNAQLGYEYSETKEAKKASLDSYKELDLRNKKAKHIEYRANKALEDNIKDYQKGIKYEDLSEEQKQVLKESSLTDSLDVVKNNSIIQKRIDSLMKMSENDGISVNNYEQEINGIITDMINENGDKNIIDQRIPYTEMRMLFIDNIEKFKNESLSDINMGNETIKNNKEEDVVDLDNKKLTDEQIDQLNQKESVRRLNEIEKQDIIKFNNEIKRNSRFKGTNRVDRSLETDKLKLFDELKNEDGSMTPENFARYMNFLRNNENVILESDYNEEPNIINVDRGKMSDFVYSDAASSYEDYLESVMDYTHALPVGGDWSSKLREVREENDLELERWKEEYDEKINKKLQ